MNNPSGNQQKNHNIKIVPRVRFPEFREDEGWDVRPLGKVCSIFNNQRQAISGDKRIKGNYPYYGASGIVDYVQDYIFDERLLLVGEDGAKWGAFEKTAFIADGKYWVNNHVHVLKCTKILDILLENYLVKLDLSLFVTGAAPPKLTLSKLKEIAIPLPLRQLEQQKIADCLSSLDDLLEAETKKLEGLKEHKKSLMQKLFPAEGETTPKFRFREFRNEEQWKKKTLVDLCTMQAGTFITAEKITKERNEELYPCYGGNGLRGFVQTYTHIGRYPLIGRQGALCGNINMGTGTFYATEHAIVVVAQKNVDVNWLYYNLIKLDLNQYATGQAQPGLSVDTLKKLSSVVPSTPLEQQKIADCLSSLDNLITSQTQKIETLKSHKKGLMQQLFPIISNEVKK